MSDGSGVAVGWATAPPTIIWFQATLDEAGTKQLSVIDRFAYGFGERVTNFHNKQAIESMETESPESK
jgi:hypothetical protein